MRAIRWVCSTDNKVVGQHTNEGERMNKTREQFAAEGRWMQRVELLALLAIAAWCVGCQPKDVIPGQWLRGDLVEEQVDDWGFTQEIEEIFIETRAWYRIPHSTTIWCVEHSGELYIGSYGDQKKRWEKNVARDPNVKLAIAGKLYESELSPVTEVDRVAALDAAYASKYDMAEVFGDEVPDWWYYHVGPSR